MPALTAKDTQENPTLDLTDTWELTTDDMCSVAVVIENNDDDNDDDDDDDWLLAWRGFEKI